jgi:large subunit ribosomal protein L22
MATTAPERKTNERPGVRAQVRHVRSSAYKAREVLDLIRGEHVTRALEILEFSERSIAKTILKCLESAIANAAHNNDIPDDELFVSACYADEGPTLKRWRPRARGRATRIRKRTTHITIIVSRLAPEELAKLRERESTSGRVANAARRERRVARSREKADRKAAERATHDHDHDDEHDDEHDETVTDETVTDETATDEVVEADGDVSEGADTEVEAATETDEASDTDDAESADDETSETTTKDAGSAGEES